MSSTLALCAFNTTLGSVLLVTQLNISGSTITPGVDTSLGRTAQSPSIDSVSATNALLVYYDVSTARGPYCTLVTVSGSTTSFSKTTALSTTTYTPTGHAVPISSTRALVMSNGYLYLVDWSGASMTVVTSLWAAYTGLVGAGTCTMSGAVVTQNLTTIVMVGRATSTTYPHVVFVSVLNGTSSYPIITPGVLQTFTSTATTAAAVITSPLSFKSMCLYNTTSIQGRLALPNILQ